MKRKVTTAVFFAAHPSFSLDEAATALTPCGGRTGTVERLKHHLKTGRLRLVARCVYVVVPAGIDAEKFQPDPILVAAAARSDAVFSHHSALELLGAAHSVWREFTLWTAKQRRAIYLGENSIRFLIHPAQMRAGKEGSFGTRRIERRGRFITVTGPERTLVEGFRRPRLVGGLEELIVSASGFPTLDFDLLLGVLRRYGNANLWAATGWFLERFQKTFHVPDSFLKRMERRCPRSPQYMERGLRGGSLATRWNVIVPQEVAKLGEPNDINDAGRMAEHPAILWKTHNVREHFKLQRKK